MQDISGLFSYSQHVFGMKERHIRIFIALAAALIFDILKPFGYTLNVDIYFLAVVSITLIYPYSPTMLWAAILSYLRDCISVTNSPINTLEAIFVFILTRYIIRQFPREKVKVITPVALIVTHIWLNAQQAHLASIWMLVIVFAQAVITYIALNHFMKSWMKFQPAEYS